MPDGWIQAGFIPFPTPSRSENQSLLQFDVWGDFGHNKSVYDRQYFG